MKALALIGAWHDSLDPMPAVILCISSVKLLFFLLGEMLGFYHFSFKSFEFFLHVQPLKTTHTVLQEGNDNDLGDSGSDMASFKEMVC